MVLLYRESKKFDYSSHNGLECESLRAFSIFWMYTLLIGEAKYGMENQALMRYLSEDGIETRPIWQPLHCSAAHKNCNSYRIEIAEKIRNQALSLPSSVGLSLTDQHRVIKEIVKSRQQ
ncbi:hypothetical protein ES703_81105 [subsurface metagenome]